MNTNDLPVIELQGTPRERGLIHGESLKTSIAAVLEHWLSDLGNYGSNDSGTTCWNVDTYLDGLLSNTRYLQAIEKTAPHLLEELKGIADASGQPFNHILGLNLMDEEWVYGLRNSLDKPTHKCTAFATSKQTDGISYAGQNMDICSWSEGYQILFRHMATEDKPEVLLFAIAGSLGLNGLNASGVGVTCNTLSQLDFATDGLPVAFVVRLILEQQGLDAAVSLLKKLHHASGQNYILSSRDQALCFECSSTSVVPYTPESLNGRLFHTNHPLISSDISTIKALAETPTANTQARLDSITQRLGNTKTKVTLSEIKAALSAHDNPSHPVSRQCNKTGSSIGYTAGSVIYEFTSPPRLHLAAGPPCETEYLCFDFLPESSLGEGDHS